MEDEKMTWLEGQVMQIPIDKYVDMRIQFFAYIEDMLKLRSENLDLEKEIKDLKIALEDAKAQIKELLGLNELEKAKLTELQFEKGVVSNDTV